MKKWKGIALSALAALSPSLALGADAVVGFESGPIATSVLPSAASHAAGTSVGGLFSIPLARINGGNGEIAGIAITSTGGYNGSYILRLWTRNPTNIATNNNVTCADNTNYADANAAVQFLIGGMPLTATTVAPGNTTGDSKYYFALTGIMWGYKNADPTATQNIYGCLVANSTDTADENAPVVITAWGPQN